VSESEPLPPWFLPALLAGFPIFFGLMWLAVTAMIAGFGGWRALAERYEGRSAAPVAAIGMGSASLGRGFLPSNYNGVLNVAVGEDGCGCRCASRAWPSPSGAAPRT
jgi:hypothetical protein